ncbi:MAG: low molecular weight phosphotyrosine protein phosphatase, partial [Selenomonas sp.]|nr:low molecular weight phosphotyrosine protein phosphatase [Selenomonas sp.]
MIKILFVCHGNICRSTMAEFVMKELVRQAGRENDIIVASKACRTDELGSDTHPGTKAALKAHGIPFTRRQARQIQRADYEEFDYIVAMDEENMRDLQRLTGGDSRHKCQLL